MGEFALGPKAAVASLVKTTLLGHGRVAKEIEQQPPQQCAYKIDYLGAYQSK
jgi:hypothetical protein